MLTVSGLALHRGLDSHYYTSWSLLSVSLIRSDKLKVGVAVPVLGGWHVYLASRGETSIESHDNSYLEGKAKADGLVRSLATAPYHN
jgi:palmitoyltransferase